MIKNPASAKIRRLVLRDRCEETKYQLTNLLITTVLLVIIGALFYGFWALLHLIFQSFIRAPFHIIPTIVVNYYEYFAISTDRKKFPHRLVPSHRLPTAISYSISLRSTGLAQDRRRNRSPSLEARSRGLPH